MQVARKLEDLVVFKQDYHGKSIYVKLPKISNHTMNQMKLMDVMEMAKEQGYSDKYSETDLMGFAIQYLDLEKDTPEGVLAMMRDKVKMDFSAWALIDYFKEIIEFKATDKEISKVVDAFAREAPSMLKIVDAELLAKEFIFNKAICAREGLKKIKMDNLKRYMPNSQKVIHHLMKKMNFHYEYCEDVHGECFTRLRKEMKKLDPLLH